MEPHIRKRIFEPFFTTKPVGQGSGMGLAMVQGIVWNYGGWIDLETAPGEGACFDVFLPAAPSLPDTQCLSDSMEYPDGSGQRILFVDDEIGICNAEALILEEAGYTVYAVTDPRDALHILKENPQNFQLVITDLNMPHMDGLKLGAEILKRWPTIPVILTSGYRHYSRVVDGEKIEAAGITEFLKKPYDKHQLVQAVYKCLRGDSKKRE